MKKISIIIPNYNGEKTLVRCLDSIVKQDYPNKEIIVIDDGSTDNSASVIKRYCKNDGVIMLSNNHCGPNVARKAGIEASSGDYVMFVDSDDYLNEGALQILMNLFSMYDVDVIRFNYCNADTGIVIGNILNKDEKRRVIDRDEVERLLLTTYGLNSLWSQIYKAELLKGIKAFESNMRFGEDYLANLEILKKTKKMLIWNDVPLYYYCTSAGSTTRMVERNSIVSNICDRVKISRMSIEIANQEKLNYKDEVVFSQIKMVRDSVMKINALNDYSKDNFVTDMKKALPDGCFEIVDEKILNRVLSRTKMIDRMKHRKIIEAIVKSNYDEIWKYLRRHRVVKKILGK